MLEKIKKLRIEAMKTKTSFSSLERGAYEAVLSSLDYQRGKGAEITDVVVIDTIKKEIKVFKEAQSSNKQVLDDYEFMAAVLSRLLPQQLTTSRLQQLYEQMWSVIEESQIINPQNPKTFLDYLDAYCGYAGQYDKAVAVKIAMNKLK